jgi:spermidine synthase
MLDVESIIHLEDPYIVLFDYMRLQLLCLLWKPDPERILIVDLGGGVFHKIFHQIHSLI